jgi:hypothetical protein
MTRNDRKNDERTEGERKREVKIRLRRMCRRKVEKYDRIRREKETKDDALNENGRN